MPDDEQGFSGAESGPSTQLSGIVANVGGRIQEILDTAERVADEIQAEADAAGQTYVEERRREADRIVQERMAELDAITELLAARAASVEREATAFVAEAEQVKWRMARLIGDNGTPADPATADGLASSEAPQAPGPTRHSVSDAAALRATQMAVAGVERSDIEDMLRAQFGIDDPAAIDRVLRPGGA